MTNLSNLVYVCREIFDENSEPTQLEIEEQASRLGINPVKELHLLSIARKCLLEPLPSNWFPCYIEKENKYFYYNIQSKISQWEHPLDEYYRRIVGKTRSEDPSTGQDISLNIISDEDNLLDNMYHTKNNNYEKKVNEKRTVRFKTPIEESLDLDNSDDNMKFLGPIKLNTPNYINTSNTLHNLPQFSTTNTFDFRNTASRSVLSKYNILPSKDESNRKSDLEVNIKKVINDSTLNVDLITEKENLRKIDITLTESSDRSESTSSEVHTENLNSDYEGNDIKENDNFVTTTEKKINESNNIVFTGERRAESINFNGLHSTRATNKHNVKKDDLVSDSGNSTEKDSKIIQSSTVINSFSATKNKMTEITQRFPLNQFTSETKLFKIKPMEEDVDIFDTKSNSVKSKPELTDNLHDERKLDESYIKLIIESKCDFIKNKLEDTIKTKENIFREEIIKKIDNLIREQKDYFEKHIEARHNELITKNELEIKNMQEKTGKSLIEECDKRYDHKISNIEQMCAENLSKFQKNVESYADMSKHKIQSELETINNELKKQFCKNSEIITDSWNQTLESYKIIELEKVKKNFEQSTEIIKRDMDLEIYQYNLEFKKKINIITEDKLNNITDQLDEALREEINVVKNRVNENSLHDASVKTYKSQSRLSVDHPERELNSEYPTTNMQIVNYSDIRKKIEHCSNELNDALKLVNEILPEKNNISLHSNKNTVSCQTENKIMSQPIPRLEEYNHNIHSNSSNIPIFNNLFDFDTKYNDYWNRANRSSNLNSNYMMTYSQVLDILSQEELKVNEAEQNLCRLIDTFNNFNRTNDYVPNKINIHQNKFNNIYPALTPKQIAYNRTKHLRDWLYKTNLNTNNTFN